MRVPRSTYRLQVQSNFRLSRVRELLDYLTALGISDLYLSPLLQARPGSTHGYDVIDPAHVNPEIGSDQDFEQLSRAVRQRGGGILLDIVPNHMAASEENPWWRDLLEHGPASAYAEFFDIDWSADPPGEGRLTLPVLGQDLKSCLDAHQVGVTIDQNLPAIAYLQRTLPLDPSTWPQVFEAWSGAAPEHAKQFGKLAAAARALPPRTHLERAPERRERSLALKEQVAELLEKVLAARTSERLCRALDREQVLELLDAQPYALSFWVPGGRQINYRRFFDISDLAGLRIELPHVFDAVHARVLTWVTDGIITGLRIDHVDGMRYPAAYLKRLHERVRPGLATEPFVVVEKILVGPETLPPGWCAAGTTGYDFIGAVNGLFIEPRGWERLGRAYLRRTGTSDFETLLYEKKLHVIGSLFPSELRSLVERALRVLPHSSAPDLQAAITELTARLPVYRTYLTDQEIPESDRQVLEQALRETAESQRGSAALAELRRILLQPAGEEERDLALRWQQFSGPVMAKGMEDTAFYNYHHLISACEVGADPATPIVSVTEFHRLMQDRQTHWPATLNASSTHDTKRSEDVRARLNVLSELSKEWLSFTDRWLGTSSVFQSDAEGVKVPDSNDELLIYQTIIGAWPLTDTDHSAFVQRLREYVLKAAREAKRHTSWRKQNRLYEDALLEFVGGLFENRDFLLELRAIEARTSFLGALNALSQLVLKLGAPGIPDFYQGTELWALTLVDPDNRQPVDYELRMRCLGQDTDPCAAMKNWRDGRIKLLVTSRGLALRERFPELFRFGEYQPVDVRGKRDRNLIAFERSYRDQRVLFVAARFFADLCTPESWPGAAEWGKTALQLRADPGRQWRDILTGRTLPANATLPAAQLLDPLPFAILELA